MPDAEALDYFFRKNLPHGNDSISESIEHFSSQIEIDKERVFLPQLRYVVSIFKYG